MLNYSFMQFDKSRADANKNHTLLIIQADRQIASVRKTCAIIMAYNAKSGRHGLHKKKAFSLVAVYLHGKIYMTQVLVT